MDLRYDFSGHATAATFGGRIYSIEAEPESKNRIPLAPPFNVYVPNSSCSLPLCGGRARSEIQQPVAVELNNVFLAGADRAFAEIWDRRTATRVFTEARTRVEGFEVGLDERLRADALDVDLVYTTDGRDFAFDFRRLEYRGLGYAGMPIELVWNPDLPRTWQDVVAAKYKPLRKMSVGSVPYETFSVFSQVSLAGRASPSGPNVIDLPGLGTARFGELTVSETAWRFTFLQLKLGSPADGAMVVDDIIRNGRW